jgi:hypothetical protein
LAASEKLLFSTRSEKILKCSKCIIKVIFYYLLFNLLLIGRLVFMYRVVAKLITQNQG